MEKREFRSLLDLRFCQRTIAFGTFTLARKSIPTPVDTCYDSVTRYEKHSEVLSSLLPVLRYTWRLVYFAEIEKVFELFRNALSNFLEWKFYRCNRDDRFRVTPKRLTYRLNTTNVSGSLELPLHPTISLRNLSLPRILRLSSRDTWYALSFKIGMRNTRLDFIVSGSRYRPPSKEEKARLNSLALKWFPQLRN